MKVVSIQFIAYMVLGALMIPVVGHSQIKSVELKCGHIIAGSVE
jgi:hypothetical protein